jgi:hypothetical protein
MGTEPNTIPARDDRPPTLAARLAAEQGVGPWDPAAWPGEPDVTAEELDRWLSDLRRLRAEGGTPEARA